MENIKNSSDIINVTYSSNKANRSIILNSIFRSIKETSIPIKIRQNELFLVIDEALTNAMEHGNHWDPKKSVKVKVTPKTNHLSITIKDEGIGFNTSFINKKPEVSKVGGRGIHIIKHYCNPKWNKSGNQIDLLIKKR